MEIAVLGLNHRTAPVDLRERLAFHEDQIPVALRAVRRDLPVLECVILSTCNRVELYTLLPERNGSEAKLKRFLTQFHRLEEEVNGCFYWHLQHHCVRHLFQVAAGLDSMVVGESEILGQVREAYAKAVSAGSVGSVFHRLFQTAIQTGKEVRSRTRIGQMATSVSSVSVELARRIFQNLRAKKVLILGAGQMAEATLRCLRGRGVESIFVVNRSLENAQLLAQTIGGQAVPFSRLEEVLVQVDIVISSAAADHFLLTQDQVHQIMVVRRQRPLFFIDISVPRNLDPAMGRLENVYLYNIDDLEGIASSNLRKRLEETDACTSIIEGKMQGFFRRFSRNGAGTIQEEALR